MNSKDLILHTCNISSASSTFLSDKETQTSKVYALDSDSSKKIISKPLPENIEAKAKDGVKVFEFSEVVKDPNDPSIVRVIKETFSEEELIESDSKCGIPTKNKFKYCKEVIQPYSKNPIPPKDCPIYPNRCKPDSCKDSKDSTQPDITYTMDDENCKTTFANPSNSSDTNENKDDKSSCCVKKNKSCKPPAICKTIDECNLKKCISACVRESLKIAKKGSAACLDKLEKAIGVKQPRDCDDKPTYYVMDKCKSKTSTESSTTSVPKKSSIQNIIDTQSQTVATITYAIKGFMGSVYNKTKEAMNMIRTESCRHLGLSEDQSSTSKGNNKTEAKTRDCSSDNTKIETQALKENIEDSSVTIEELSQSYSFDNILKPAKDTYNHVASVVDSTISVLRNSSFDDIIESKINQSSSHDNPTGKVTPKKIAQDREPAAHSSVFAMLKSKIFSIFDMSKEKCDDGNASDEDYDSESAENFFEKFCEQ